MSLKHYPLVIAMLSLIISACKKHGEKPNVDVYTAGYIIATNGHPIAAYWKNGALVRLADSSSSSVANAIAVQGNDVYVAGNITSSEQTGIAVIWKNGVVTKLTDGSSSADARAITISNGIVYAAGYLNNFQAVYWKNNVVNDLSASAVGNAIVVNDGNVYVAGMLFDTAIVNNETAYWKNGVATEFVIPTPGNSFDYISGSGSGIVVNPSGVYVTGYAGGGKYWKNGTENDLSNGNFCYPSAIAVSGNDVYLAGSTDSSSPGPLSTATYWKNGLAVPLAGNSSPSFAYSIALNGSDVYVGGAVNGSAVYWKNGTAVELALKGAVYSIILASH